MILAPHPDDETLAAGGLLQQALAAGAEVRVIFVTDGDNNPWPQRVIERRWRIGAVDRARWGARRRDEAVAALACLGVPAAGAVFLHYPDQGLSSLLMSGDEKPLIALAEAITAWRPTLLVMPSELDRHPDHSALALMARFALSRLRSDERRFTTIQYLIHSPHPPPASRGWRTLPLSHSEQVRKREAILRHASQLVLSRQRFLAFAGDCERFMVSADPNDREGVGPGAIRKEPVVCCVVPCYNLAAFCEEVVRGAAARVDQVIVVDDGSTDGTGEILGRIAAESHGRVHRISFPSNRGKGVALLEAFRYALEKVPFDLLITLDGDGQHRPADIPRLVRAWREEGAMLVIGERVRFGTMPLRSRIGNTVTGALLRWIHPESPRDTQSGFRALDRRFVTEVVRLIHGRRYETELQMLLLALGYHQTIRTVPIETLYLNGNRSSHFRPIMDSLRIYWMLLTWRLPVPEGDPYSEEVL